MDKALKIFRANLERVRSLHALHLNFSGLVTTIVDLSDLLRAELVLVVSAIDHFIHELTSLGMMEIWRGERQVTPAYQKFSVSCYVASQLASLMGAEGYLETEIRTRLGLQSFQKPDQIADAVRLFSPVELWKELGALLGEDPHDLKVQLKLVVDRRNKIAHEADIDPSYPGQRWPIHPQDAEDALAVVEKLGEAIYKLVA